MKRYFYITIHFSPNYEGTVLLNHKDDLYIDVETGEIYRKRLMCDFGWGQENGFELMPQLPFDELIKLVECPAVQIRKRPFRKYTEEELLQINIWRCNLYGAIAVIMQDHVEKLIEFLASKINTDYFSNSSIRKNFKQFAFDSKKTIAEGRIPGGVLSRSYEDILMDYSQWRKISSKVISQVYADGCDAISGKRY